MQTRSPPSTLSPGDPELPAAVLLHHHGASPLPLEASLCCCPGIVLPGRYAFRCFLPQTVSIQCCCHARLCHRLVRSMDGARGFFPVSCSYHYHGHTANPGE